MWEKEQKQKCIFDLLDAETEGKKISDKIEGFFFCLYQTQTLNPLMTVYESFWKSKQMQLPIQILAPLRLQLNRMV